MIEFKCSHCGKGLKLPHSYAGKTTSCPTCLRPVVVPGTPAEAAPTPLRPKPRAAGPTLCVDCGRTISAAEAMEHDGQTVCGDCFHKRKAAAEANAAVAAKAKAALEAKAKRAARGTPTRRRKLLIAIALLVVIVVVLWLIFR